jgi:hypothetical protein
VQDVEVPVTALAEFMDFFRESGSNRGPSSGTRRRPL